MIKAKKIFAVNYGKKSGDHYGFFLDFEVRIFVTKWEKDYPKSVKCLQKDIENFLTFFSIRYANLWNEIRNTILKDALKKFAGEQGLWACWLIKPAWEEYYILSLHTKFQTKYCHPFLSDTKK